MVVARAALHFWEEPCISGVHKDTENKRGSGAIFFCGCPLGCVFCQNYEISRACGAEKGKKITVPELADIMLRLEAEGAYNINLVSPTQYTAQIVKALEKVKPRLTVPVIWNTGGYELTETLKTLDGLVDIWLPDIKYYSPEISERYCSARDYFGYASEAALFMYGMCGPIRFGDGGIAESGLIIRHMVMPSRRRDSMDIIRWISANFSAGDIRVSLMSQYTPTGMTSGMPELERRVTSFEYDTVVELADSLGLKGWSQSRESVGKSYTPPFDCTGVRG